MYLYYIGSVVFTLAVIADLFSLFLNLKSVARKGGASGVPFLSWIIYFGYFGYIYEKGKMSNLGYFFFMTVFHVMCHYLIPKIYSKALVRKKKRN